MQARSRSELFVKDDQKRVDAHFQTTAAYWKHVYEGHDVEATIYQQRRDAVLKLVDKLALPHGSQVLEVGCGAGLTSVALACRGFQVEAVDSVPAMIGLTRQAVRESGLEQEVRAGVCDVNDLSFTDSAFDLVLAIGVIPWVQSPGPVLREMVRVVKPGGYLIVSSENLWQLPHLLDPLLMPLLAGVRPRIGDLLRKVGLRKPLAAPRHHACSNRAFDRALASFGMKKLEATTLGFGPFSFCFRRMVPEPWGVSIHRGLQRLSDRRFPLLRSTGSNYIVVTRKPANPAMVAA